MNSIPNEFFHHFLKNFFIQNRCLLHVYLQFWLWILGHNWSFQLNRLLAFFSKKNQREGEKRAQFKAFEPSEQKKIQKREKIIFSETNAYRLLNSVHYFIFAFFVTKNNDAILSFSCKAHKSCKKMHWKQLTIPT